MKAFTTVTSRAVVLDRVDVDTDQIIPKQFLKRIERTGFGDFLFFDWMKDPAFELHQQSGWSILLADGTSTTARRASMHRGRCRTTTSTS